MSRVGVVNHVARPSVLKGERKEKDPVPGSEEVSEDEQTIDLRLFNRSNGKRKRSPPGGRE